MKEKTVVIIHYNTPELTAGAIGSLLKNGGGPFRVVVFDNSDKRPFEPATNVTVIDNTRGQVIDFEKELAKFPDRDRGIGCAKGCEFGSAKHMMTVQKLWELIPQGFVLMESDILIKKNIDEFFAEEYSVYGYCQKAQPHNPYGIGRMLPMLCWMNVPMLTREGARYFDPTRTYGLLPGGRNNRNNWYDTGAVLLEDILRKRPRLRGYHRDIREFVEHYGSASWKDNDVEKQMAWLAAHKHLLPTADENVKMPVYQPIAICAIGRLENRYAVEWVEHYKALGVSKIYIYDNNRPDDGETFHDVLADYEKDGLVQIIPHTGTQKQAYEDCYNRFSRYHDWMGFFDFDELVEVQNGRSIQDLLEGFGFADVLALNWRTMTDSGQLHYSPEPMKERFTEATGEDFAINRHVKSFVRSDVVGISMNDPHMPNAPRLNVANVHGIRIEQIPVQPQVIHDIARVDHYNTKSTEEWQAKVARGWKDASPEAIARRKANAMNYYFAINERSRDKEVILGIAPAEPEPEPAPAVQTSEPELPSFDEAQGTPVIPATKTAAAPTKPAAAKAKSSSKPKSGKRSTNKKK